jgi:hypothetical protein
VGTAVTKAASERSIKTALLMISPLSLKHLARQRSLWQGALVSQQPQSFDVCFAALLGQSGMSAMAAESACADAAMAAPIGASATLTAISNASRIRCTAKANLRTPLSSGPRERVKQPFQASLTSTFL